MSLNFFMILNPGIDPHHSYLDTMGDPWRTTLSTSSITIGIGTKIFCAVRKFRCINLSKLLTSKVIINECSIKHRKNGILEKSSGNAQ